MLEVLLTECENCWWPLSERGTLKCALIFYGHPTPIKLWKLNISLILSSRDGAGNGDQKTSSKKLEVLLTECEDCWWPLSEWGRVIMGRVVRYNGRHWNGWSDGNYPLHNQRAPPQRYKIYIFGEPVTPQKPVTSSAVMWKLSTLRIAPTTLCCIISDFSYMPLEFWLM